MKRLLMTAISIFLIAGASTASMAASRQVESMVIGGAGGALVGQAVGHDAESTVIGAAIGSVIGAVANQPTTTHKVYETRTTHVYHAPRPTTTVIHEHYNPRPRKVIHKYYNPRPRVVYHSAPYKVKHIHKRHGHGHWKGKGHHRAKFHRDHSRFYREVRYHH